MSELNARIRKASLRQRIMKAEDTVPFFKNGMDLGFSGFGGGHPKAVPGALADHVEKNNLQGKLRFNVFTGASIGADIEDRWASLGMTDRRWPYQTGDIIRKEINNGHVRMGDKHLSLFAHDLGCGYYTPEKSGKLDIAIIEATDITEDGGIVLSSAVGVSNEIIQIAENIIIEINTAVPSCEGLHDIVMSRRPSDRQPYMITRVGDRIGTTNVPCDNSKIIAIIESKKLGIGRALGPPDKDSELIAAHILDFFQFEIKRGRLPKNLLPLQSGVGSIANAVAGGLIKGPFSNLEMWTEIMQDTILDFLDSGKLNFASATSFALSPDGLKRLYDNWEKYTGKIILRPIQISNHPELIRRLAVIAMNTAVEFDIYGHANSSLVGGTRMVNGIGGSGDFLRNAYLSIMHAPSVRATKTDPTGISCVLPMASHVDQTEHDLDVLITEQGLADLRGLCPRDRAQTIINKCVHPEYKPILQEYFDRAARKCLTEGAGHQPQILYKAFKMQQNLEENGTMKIDNWD